MTTPQKDYTLHFTSVGLVGLISFLLTLVLSSQQNQFRVGTINVLIQVSGVLLGFGGTVFAVLYTTTRSVIANHRTERSKEIKQVISETNLPSNQRHHLKNRASPYVAMNSP